MGDIAFAPFLPCMIDFTIRHGVGTVRVPYAEKNRRDSRKFEELWDFMGQVGHGDLQVEGRVG